MKTLFKKIIYKIKVWAIARTFIKQGYSVKDSKQIAKNIIDLQSKQ